MASHPRRHRCIFGLLTFCLLIGAALTASPVQAASGIAPFFPEEAWDRKMVPVNRFLILTNWGNEAVLDKETGLVWERAPLVTTHTWALARLECTGRTTGGRKGWRLPSVHERATLVDPAKFTPSLPTGHPFINVQQAGYWSATTDADNSANAWDVFFSVGGVAVRDKTQATDLVWCVRGGMNADQY